MHRPGSSQAQREPRSQAQVGATNRVSRSGKSITLTRRKRFSEGCFHRLDPTPSVPVGSGRIGGLFRSVTSVFRLTERSLPAPGLWVRCFAQEQSFE